MLYVHTAERVDLLVRRLAEVMAQPPDDPFTPEWLATPTDGLRRWVSLELARHLGAGPGRADGVAANIVRAYPDALRRAVLAADPEAPADGTDPWAVDRLVWAVFEVLAGASPDRGLPSPSYGAARSTADLFDRYHLHRPSMVRQWAVGDDVDSLGRSLAAPDRWQPVLWRTVRDRVGIEAPPERLPRLLEDVRSGRLDVELPPRLSFFGFSALPAGPFLDVVRTVAGHRDVHLFVPDPTHYDAPDLLAHSPVDPGTGVRLRTEDSTSELALHPLARSWGRLHRESSVLLAAVGADAVHDRVDAVDGLVPAAPDETGTLLARLQAHVRTNVPASPGVGDAVARDDRSVCFHSCFGRIRQVEVARDAILHELATAEGNLSEDDVVVVCPAIDRFAPLIEAVFGRPAPAGGELPNAAPLERGAPALRYRIADRSLGAANPVLGALAALLELVAGRFDVASVVDFLALAPVRCRFGFGDDELGLIGEWAAAANVRCGVDPEQRSVLGIPASVDGNTWRSAIDRLVLGAVVADQGEGLAVGDVLPIGVERPDHVRLVGRLAEALAAVGDAAVFIGQTDTVSGWVERLRGVAGRLFAVPPAFSFQVEQLERLLGDVREAGVVGDHAASPSLGFAEIRRVVTEHSGAQSGRAADFFFRGGITVTSTRPLRWVPAKVVVLLGMDESAFAVDREHGDDLTQIAPQVGDRDARADAREALLETILSATERLIVIREGHDVRTNQPVPMAVITAELRDALLDEVPTVERTAWSEALEVEHPRHPFDDRCFVEGALIPGSPWGFDTHDRDAAASRRRAKTAAESFVVEPLPALDQPTVDLHDLQTFFKNPSQAFLSERLGARLPRRSEDAKVVVPPELDALESWSVATRLLDARVAGASVEEWLRLERRRGSLPPGALGDNEAAELVDQVDSLLSTAVARGFQPGEDEPVLVDAETSTGLRVVGSVPCQLGGPGPGPVHIDFSRYKPNHKMRAWLELMALTVSDPSVRWRALAVSRGATSKDPPVVTELTVALGKDGTPAVDPRAALDIAVDCYRRGLCEPLPWFPRLSPARLATRRPPSKLWHDTWRPGDGDDPAVALAFGAADYQTIVALPPRPTDPGSQGDRLDRYAKYLCREVARSAADHGDSKKPTGEARSPKATSSKNGATPAKAKGAPAKTRRGATGKGAT